MRGVPASFSGLPDRRSGAVRHRRPTTTGVTAATPWVRSFAIGYVLLLVVLTTAQIGSPHPKRGYLKELPSRITRRAVVDGIVNVGIFVPLGWSLRRLIDRRREGAVGTVLTVALVGAVVSVTVETIQHFMPLRYSSISDVAFNTLGTVVGSLATRQGVRQVAGPSP